MKAQAKMLAMGAVFFVAGAAAGPRIFHVGTVRADEVKPYHQPVVQTLDNRVGCPYDDQNGHHHRSGHRDGQPSCWQYNHGSQGQG